MTIAAFQPLPAVVVFECKCNLTVVGEQVCVVGSVPELGNWNVLNAITLSTSSQQFPRWISCPCELKLTPEGERVEFKFLICGLGRIIWEEGGNRQFRCPEVGHLARVRGDFGQGPSVIVTISVAPNPSVAEAHTGLRSPPQSVKKTALLTNSPSFNVLFPEDALISFTAPYEALSALNSAANVTCFRTLQKKHENTKSLRERLKFLNELISDSVSGPTNELSSMLAMTGLYAEWLATSVIHCDEDGSHFRPNHVANSAQMIVQNVEIYLSNQRRELQELKSQDWLVDLNTSLSRYLFRMLPSFDSGFTAAVPMTRIRDIAHRNDIPSHVKNEIKHNLQNKLHRCAAPSDLKTCRELLEKYRHMNLGGAFLSEFELFEQELTKFFNMQSTRERLAEVKRRIGEFSGAVDNYTQAVYDADYSRCEGVYGFHSSSVLIKLLRAIQAGASLRKKFIVFLARHITENQYFPDGNPSDGQLARLSEIQIEIDIVVLSSRFLEILAKHNSMMSIIDLRQWLFQLLSNSLHHLSISGFASPLAALLAYECKNLVDSKFVSDLLAESICQRILRLTCTYSDFIATAFKQSLQFADALHVKTATSAIFAESHVRGSLSFQIARAAQTVHQTLHTRMFEALHGGVFQGFLVHIPALSLPEEAHLASEIKDHEKVVLAVDEVTGYEEIDNLLQRLRQLGATKLKAIGGIVTRQSVPLLSHLGLRVRQNHLPFICVVSPTFNWHASLEPWIGKEVRIDVESTTLFCPTIAIDLVDDVIPPSPTNLVTVPTFEHNSFVVLAGSDITQPTCGNKAAVCAQLQSVLRKTGLVGPPCLGLPFNAMENAFKWKVNATQFTEFLMHKQQLRSYRDAGFQGNSTMAFDLNKICEGLRNAIFNLTLTRDAMNMLRDAITFHFLSDDINLLESQRLALYVRSSSTHEDTSTTSGAGLYESVTSTVTWNLAASTNTNHSGHSAFTQTLYVSNLWTGIKQVWASLYTQRAVLSRSGDIAEMAVLIQPVVNASWSFYAHTRAPKTLKKDGLYIELVKGLGEPLAGGAASVGGGRSQRLLLSKRKTEILGFWSMWGAVKQELIPCFVGLSEDEHSEDFWINLAERLKQIQRLETLLNGPQDVEGCIVDGNVFIVQSRPQTD